MLKHLVLSVPRKWNVWLHFEQNVLFRQFSQFKRLVEQG